MRTAVPVVVGLFIVLACSSLKPVAINTGDVCENCKRVIVNTRVAAEIVEPNGLALKFRTVSCMAKFMAQRTGEGGGIFVTDFNTGRFVAASSAVFVKAPIDESTNERDFLAFRDVASAVEHGRTVGSSPVDWPSVLKQTAAAAN